MTESVVEFKIRVLEEALRVLSPSRRSFVTTALLSSKMPQLIIEILSSRLIVLLAGQLSR